MLFTFLNVRSINHIIRINDKNGMRTLPWRLVGKLTKEELFPPVDMDTSDLHT